MPSNKMKKIPKFRNEDEEREFWSTADASDYFDWDEAQFASLTELGPATKTISLRLPEGLLEEIKLLARQRDVPYQSLMKLYLALQVQNEIGTRAPSKSKH